MRYHAFVLASMYKYSWLITFEIFLNFFFGDRGVGGVYCIQTFFGFLYFFIFTRPLRLIRFISQIGIHLFCTEIRVYITHG